MGACTPLTESRGGGRGASAWGGRGSSRHQAVYGRDGARRGGVRECSSGGVGRQHGVRRTLEEEKARLLHLEVRSRFFECLRFEGSELKLLSPCR
jgi:hypothetical protein